MIDFFYSPVNFSLFSDSTELCHYCYTLHFIRRSTGNCARTNAVHMSVIDLEIVIPNELSIKSSAHNCSIFWANINHGGETNNVTTWYWEMVQKLSSAIKGKFRLWKSEKIKLSVPGTTDLGCICCKVPFLEWSAPNYCETIKNKAPRQAKFDLMKPYLTIFAT